MIKDSIAKVVIGENLSEAQMESTMAEIMSGTATPAQIGAFITALRIKGETVEEITGAARVMREKATKIDLTNGQVNLDRDEINVERETILDTCGTGGDGTHTFNVSTATAFVAAGAGVRVAKHGNRAVSSLCGSADVLNSLGVNLEMAYADVRKCILTVGIGFLFAPLYHGAMKYAAAPRQEIGIRTIFNLLGPLTNPAGATAQVLGVYAPELTEKMAQVLNKLGSHQAFVVCGKGTYDEISICGPTKISHLKAGEVDTFELTPEQYGLSIAAPEDIRGGDAAQSALIIENLLNGDPGPRRDIVLLNAAAAFIATELDADFKAGIARAEDAIDSGRAMQKLKDLVAFGRPS